jgi:hypothetical protein
VGVAFESGQGSGELPEVQAVRLGEEVTDWNGPYEVGVSPAYQVRRDADGSFKESFDGSTWVDATWRRKPCIHGSFENCSRCLDILLDERNSDSPHPSLLHGYQSQVLKMAKMTQASEVPDIYDVSDMD